MRAITPAVPAACRCHLTGTRPGVPGSSQAQPGSSSSQVPPSQTPVPGTVPIPYLEAASWATRGLDRTASPCTDSPTFRHPCPWALAFVLTAGKTLQPLPLKPS